MQPDRSSVVRRIAAKELTLFFAAPTGYLFLAAFLAVTLFVFFWVEAWFARNVADVRPMFEWLPVLLIFLSSALTMRMWSEERRSGTMELVFTSPAGTWEFVLGKFLACWALIGVALALTLPLPVSAAFIADLDWGPVLAGYVAAVLLGGAYTAIGLFVSARTDSQIVSLIVASFACGVFYLAGSPVLTELMPGTIADFFRSIGSGSRFEAITRGGSRPARPLLLHLAGRRIPGTERLRAGSAALGSGRRQEPPPGLVAGHRPPGGQPAGGQPLAGLAHGPARGHDRRPHLLDLGSHPRLSRPAAGAPPDPRLLQQPDPPAAGAAGAAHARPAHRVRGGRAGRGPGGDRRSRRRPGTGRRGQHQVRHPLGAVPGRRPLPVEPGQLLLRCALELRGRIRSAGLPRPDRGQGTGGGGPRRPAQEPGIRPHPGDQEGALRLPGRQQHLRQHPGTGTLRRLPVGRRPAAGGTGRTPGRSDGGAGIHG